ncbi:MAG: arsenate reductase (glutaredoxin) [Woeseiaceae bacterium]|nr:arsenate reductase (glutaredoxin) [Woeseiaceae bacterium]
MTITIYHNPRCSKSRKTLELIEAAGISPEIVNYLDSPPPASRILELAAKIGVAVAELLRRNEDVFKNADDLPALDNDAAIASWISKNPRVLQRPIVIDDDSGVAIVARPPENVHELLHS